MKMTVIVVLLLVAAYWLFDHSAPLPFNHDQLGLHDHNVHRAIGVIILVFAGLMAWKWNPKKK